MKKAWIVVAIVVALAAAAAFWAYGSLDVIVRVALEHYGPEVTGVPVHVSGVDISPVDGRGVVRGLEIGTPPGFAAPRTARVGEIRVSLDPATLTQPLVHVRELAIVAPEITYERTDRGTNLGAIRDNIKRHIAATGGPSADRPAEARRGGRKFVIDELRITGIKVTMTEPGLRGQGIAFDVPDVQLSDVGRRQGGLTPSEVGDAVAGELEARIAQKVLTNLQLLRKGGVKGAIDALKGLLR